MIGCTDVSQEAHKETSRKTCIKLPVCSVGARETARESTSAAVEYEIYRHLLPHDLLPPAAVHVNPRRRDRKANDNPQKVRR